MGFSSSAGDVFLLHKNSNFSTKGRVDLILSPDLYWCKTFSIPISDPKEIKLLLPTYFEDYIEDTTNCSYYFISLDEPKMYLCFAYKQDEVVEAITQSGLTLSQVNKIYFAQNEFLEFDEIPDEPHQAQSEQDDTPSIAISQAPLPSKDIEKDIEDDPHAASNGESSDYAEGSEDNADTNTSSNENSNPQDTILPAQTPSDKPQDMLPDNEQEVNEVSNSNQNENADTNADTNTSDEKSDDAKDDANTSDNENTNTDENAQQSNEQNEQDKQDDEKISSDEALADISQKGIEDDTPTYSTLPGLDNIFRVGEKYFAYQHSYLVQIPKSICVHLDVPEVDIRLISLSSHSISITYDAKYISLFALSVICFVLVFASVINYAKSYEMFMLNNQLDAKMQELKKNAKTPKTFLETRAIIKKYERYASKYDNIRKILESIINFQDSLNGSLKSISLKQNEVVCKFDKGRLSALKDYFSKDHKITISRDEQNIIEVKFKIKWKHLFIY